VIRTICSTLALALCLAACGSGGGNGSKTTLPNVPPRKDPLSQLEVQPKKIDVPPPKIGDGREFTKEERATMSRALGAFIRDEKSWPREKALWLAMRAKTHEVLVENLFGYLLRWQTGGRVSGVDRAKSELVSLGDRPVKHLAATVRLVSVVDRTGKTQRVDVLTRSTAAEILTLIQSPAAEAGLVAATRDKDETSRRIAVKSLALFETPTSLEARMRCLRDPSFQVAAQAAQSLTTAPADARVSRVLADLFGDRSADRFVRQKAGQALYVRKDPAAVPMLIDLLDRARRGGEVALARETTKILRRTTGLNHGPDAAVWRSAVGGDR
jgi:hypothetical protein